MSGFLESKAPPTQAPSAADTPPAAPEPESLSTLGRGRARRRLRYLQRLYESQLRDIAGLILELHRAGLERPELIRSKVESAARTDLERRTLERELGQPVSGTGRSTDARTCPHCHADLADDQEWCLECGTPTTVIDGVPDWRVPVLIVAFVVAIALAGYFIALSSISP